MRGECDLILTLVTLLHSKAHSSGVESTFFWDHPPSREDGLWKSDRAWSESEWCCGREAGAGPQDWWGAAWTPLMAHMAIGYWACVNMCSYFLPCSPSFAYFFFSSILTFQELHSLGSRPWGFRRFFLRCWQSSWSVMAAVSSQHWGLWWRGLKPFSLLCQKSFTKLKVGLQKLIMIYNLRAQE